MTNKMRDILCAIIVIAFGAAMIYFVKDVRRVIRTDVGSAFVPTLIGWCIVITGACKLFYSIFTGLKEESNRIRCCKRGVFVPANVIVQREKQQAYYFVRCDCRIASAGY